MKKEIQDLIEISRYFGGNKDYTLGGGGNTSYKDADHLYVKASGFALSTITEEGFAVLDRKKLAQIMDKKYSEEAHQREEEVKEDLVQCNVNKDKPLRPSVEASLHDLIDYPFIVHMHPYLVNALMCSNHAGEQTKQLFDDEALFVPYIDPGYTLSKTLSEYLKDFRQAKGKDPQIIFLQNHGVFVGAGSTGEIKALYSFIFDRIKTQVHEIIKIEPIIYSGPMDTILAILSGLFGKEKAIKYRFNTLIEHFTKDDNSISRIDKPFTPDGIVYCRAYPLVIPMGEDQVISLATVEKVLETYRQKFKYDPKIVMLERGPVISIENKESSAELVLDVFEDTMKISFYSNYFGGPHFMMKEQIQFIESWEVESFRRKLSVGNA